MRLADATCDGHGTGREVVGRPCSARGPLSWGCVPRRCRRSPSRRSRGRQSPVRRQTARLQSAPGADEMRGRSDAAVVGTPSLPLRDAIVSGRPSAAPLEGRRGSGSRDRAAEAYTGHMAPAAQQPDLAPIRSPLRQRTPSRRPTEGARECRYAGGLGRSRIVEPRGTLFSARSEGYRARPHRRARGFVCRPRPGSSAGSTR